MSEQAKKSSSMKKVISGIVAGVVCIVAACMLLSSIVITDAGEYTVIRQFGQIKRVEKEPGLSFKTPIVQSKSTISSKELLYDIAPSDVITSDKKSMVVDAVVTWRIEDPMVFIKKLNGALSGAETRIDATMYNAMKNVIGSMTQEELINARESGFKEKIMEQVGNQLDAYGIKIVRFEEKQLDLPDSNKDAVYRRMISERENIAASYQAQGKEAADRIKNDADKQVRNLLSEAQAKADALIAEGDAEYMSMLSKVYNDADKADFYEFVIALDAFEKSMQGDKTIMIDKDSPIAKILYSNK